MHAYMHAVSFAVHKLWSHQGGQTVEAGSDSRFDSAGDSGPIPRRLRLIRFPVEMMT